MLNKICLNSYCLTVVNGLHSENFYLTGSAVHVTWRKPLQQGTVLIDGDPANNFNTKLNKT